MAQPHVLAGIMFGLEIAFSIALVVENKALES
jgi:hypothetical protein